MRLLALDTATERMAVALADGDVHWHLNTEGGALASTQLIPCLLQALADRGLTLADLDALACGIGPGAFTGLRTAVSVTQGLAHGAGKPVLAIDSLLIVAEDARWQAAAAEPASGQGPLPSEGSPWSVWVLMDARMDEIYAAAYEHREGAWQVRRAPALYSLDALAAVWQVQPPERAAGSALTAFGSRLPWPAAVPPGWPAEADRAAALLRLAREAQSAGAHQRPASLLPVYVRDQVALTTEERAALKARLALPPEAAP